MSNSMYSTRYRLVASVLKRARERRGWSQAKAALVTGSSRTWIGKIERCELRLDVIQLMHLCHHYGIGLQRLIRRLEDEPSDEDGSFLPVGLWGYSTVPDTGRTAWVSPLTSRRKISSMHCMARSHTSSRCQVSGAGGAISSPPHFHPLRPIVRDRAPRRRSGSPPAADNR